MHKYPNCTLSSHLVRHLFSGRNLEFLVFSGVLGKLGYYLNPVIIGKYSSYGERYIGFEPKLHFKELVR